ncbi:Uncharacterized protein GBIM_05987 [Gryllus bimaculatus]|nr:Uncharacterized protein GBIM_05987 [Gryllus bimaculatus]
MFIIMGVTWLMGTLAVLARWPALWYPFVVLNGLQGAFIFVMFDVKRSVLSMLWERVLGPRPLPAPLRSPRSPRSTQHASEASRRTATTCSFSVSPEPKCFLVSLSAIRMALDRYKTLQLVIEHFEAFAKEHVGKFVNPSL